MVRIALIGAGYVADFYMLTLQNHQGLQISGVWDHDPARLAAFCAYHGLKPYTGLDDALADPSVQIIANLVSPAAHYEISRRALEAGHHVYSEKPLALHLAEAEELVAMARERGLYLSSAPANGLGPACRQVAALIAGGTIGQPRLAYAELEDGPVSRMDWQSWRSASGAPWPGGEEFRTGCTLEHAGYAISWLLALFGGVERISAHAALVSGPDGAEDPLRGPDYSSGSLVFTSGMVARLTCGLTASRNHSLTIFGDTGTITVTDLWDIRSPVYLRRADDRPTMVARLVGWLGRRSRRHIPWTPSPGRRLRPPPSDVVVPAWPSQIDFAAGLADLAQAIRNGTAPVLANEAALHLTEIALRLDGRDFPQHGEGRLVNRLPDGFYGNTR